MKREREKHITRLHLILFGFVVVVGLIVFFAVKAKINNSSDKYKEWETIIVESGKNYYDIHDIDIEIGYYKRININKLYDEGLLAEEDIIKKCNGYVEINNEGDFSGEDDYITFNAYITCGKKYTTVGYEK